MPPKKISQKTNKKYKFDFSLFLIFCIFFVSAMHVLLAWLAGGIIMFWDFKGGKVNAPPADQVTYLTDKSEYMLGEKIKLSLVNNSPDPIYLAPCKYFYRFERKVFSPAYAGGFKWQGGNLVEARCDTKDAGGADETFSTVKKSIDQYLSTVNFGAGFYRGVSTVYFGCAKANVAACGDEATVYSNEFAIKAKSDAGTPSVAPTITPILTPTPTRNPGTADCQSDSDCGIGGCSGQICALRGDAGKIITTCEMRPEYGCLRKTTCGCVSGKCQWNYNEAYQNCLRDLSTQGSVSSPQ